VFHLKAYEVPDASRQAKGLPVINLISLDPGDTVTAVEVVPSFDEGDYFIMATRRGEIKKTPLHDFASVRSSGLIAMSLEDGDEMVWVRYCHKGDEVILVSEHGQSIRFSESQLRAASRTSGGVRGIKLEPEDSLVAMEIVDPEQDLLLVTSEGFGKRTNLSEFSPQGRGGSGVRALKVTSKTGPVAAARVVKPTEELVVISSGGLVIRTPVEMIPCYGRSSQGVNVMNLNEGDKVASISLTNGNEEERQGAPVPKADGMPPEAVSDEAEVEEPSGASEDEPVADGSDQTD
jgi:DNA gyrase subunit A